MTTDPFERAAAREQSMTAERRAAPLRRGVALAFRIHLMVYLAVQLLLFVIWLQIDLSLSHGQTETPWFIYPLLGWGIGLAAHWVVTREVSQSHPR